MDYLTYCISFQHYIADSILSIATDDVDLQKSAAKLVPAMLVSVVVVVCYPFLGFYTVHYCTSCATDERYMHLTPPNYFFRCLSSSTIIPWLHYINITILIIDWNVPKLAC